MDERVAARSLVTDRDETLVRIAAMTAELDAVAAAASGSNRDDEHDPEGSTLAFEREQLAALRARARHHLAEVDAALERLVAGRYGACERCSHEIVDERLVALPAVRLCVACAVAIS